MDLRFFTQRERIPAMSEILSDKELAHDLLSMLAEYRRTQDVFGQQPALSYRGHFGPINSHKMLNKMAAWIHDNYRDIASLRSALDRITRAPTHATNPLAEMVTMAKEELERTAHFAALERRLDTISLANAALAPAREPSQRQVQELRERAGCPEPVPQPADEYDWRPCGRAYVHTHGGYYITYHERQRLVTVPYESRQLSEDDEGTQYEVWGPLLRYEVKTVSERTGRHRPLPFRTWHSVVPATLFAVAKRKP